MIRRTLTRRAVLGLAGILGATLAVARALPVRAAQARQWWTPTPDMDALTCIHTRRSVRSYTDEDVGDEKIRALLGAAMAAPSAGNEQPWEFVVLRDRDALRRVGDINHYARYAVNAPVAVLVCGNLQRQKYSGYWIEDVSAATQNMLLAAHALGLGAVWTGIYPHDDRVLPFRELIKAPEHIVPMALVVVGHPAESPQAVDRFDAERIHVGRWGGRRAS